MSEFEMDSLDAVELCMECEYKFGIEFSDEDMENALKENWTIKQLINFIQTQAKQTNDNNYIIM